MMTHETRENGPLPKEIASRMVPVIRKIACRLARRLPPHVCVDDLVSAGFLGLVNAYRRFDATRGDDFHAYAEVRIRGAMIDELRAIDPLSRDLRAHAKRAAAATRALEARLGRAPTEAELAAELGLELAVLQSFSARTAVGPAMSLDGASDEAPIQLRDGDSTPADELHYQHQLRSNLRLALEALPPRLRQVVELYYGEELKLRDIGAMLGVTESRVCQLQTEAVARMRAHCEKQAGGSKKARASVAAAA